MASYKKYIRRNHKPFVSAVGDLNRGDSINQVKAETDKSVVTVCVKEEPFVSDEYDLQPVKPDIVGIDAITSITAESSTDTSKYGCNYSTDVKVKTEELSFIKNEPGASNNNESIETTTIKIEDDDLPYCEHNYTKEQQGKSSSGNIERPFNEDEEAGPSTSCELKTEVDLDAVKMDEEGITGSESTEGEDSESNKQDAATDVRFTCYVCSYTTNKMLDLEKHREDVHGFKSWIRTCNSCNYTTNRAHLLRVHLRNHLKQCFKDFVCFVCKKRLTTQLNFQSHVVRNHSENNELMKYVTQKYLICPCCGFKTLAKRNFTEHMSKRTDEEGTYKCHICNFEAIRKKCFKFHLKLHRKHIRASPTCGFGIFADTGIAVCCMRPTA